MKTTNQLFLRGAEVYTREWHQGKMKETKACKEATAIYRTHLARKSLCWALGDEAPAEPHGGKSGPQILSTTSEAARLRAYRVRQKAEKELFNK